MSNSTLARLTEKQDSVLLETYLVTQNNNALYASKITENEITVSVEEQKIKSEMRWRGLWLYQIKDS